MAQNVALVTRSLSYGASTYVSTALSSTGQLVATGRGTVYDVLAAYTGATHGYVFLFDALHVADVTFGTTTPIAALAAYPGTAHAGLTYGWSFNKGLVVYASNSPTALGAPDTALVVTVSYAVDTFH